MFNQAYLAKETQQAVFESFKKQGFIRLSQFLDEQRYLQLAHHLWNLSGKLINKADECTYIELSSKDVIAGLATPELNKLLETFLGRKFKLSNISVRRFYRGNFTLIRDEEKKKDKNKVKFFFIISGRWDSSWGGSLIYNINDGQPLIFPVEGNCLNLIKENKDMHSFVKYLNHHAGKESFIVVEANIV